MVRRVGRTAGLIALAGAGALGWSLIEAQWFALRRVRVPVLPAGSAELSVLHVSDLHLVPTQRRKIEWVRQLAVLEPDLVINTGDNMAHDDAMPAVLEAFEPLLGVPGAFVMGSNDYYAPVMKNPLKYFTAHSGPPVRPPRRLPGKELGAAFSASGWKDLTNRRDDVEVNGLRIALVGVDDPHLERDRFPAPSGGHTGDDAPALRFGVAHAPYTRVLDQMQADGADAIFAGHTHGGQLCVPVLGALVTNCDLDTRRAKGLHGWPGPRPDGDGGAESTWLHVSAGLGTSPYTPVRFACRPEATLLTLTAVDATH